MSGGLSLPTVSARIDGDVSGMVSQFKKAEVQASLTSAKLDSEVGELQRKISRRFSLGHLGTEVLRGLGIGTGMQVAQMAAEAMAKHWREAAESAKEVERLTGEMAKTNKANAEERLTDAQRMQLLTLNLSRAEKKKKEDDDQVINNASGGERMGLGRSSRAAEWLRGLFTNRREQKTPDQEKASAGLAKDVTDLAVARDNLGRRMDAAFARSSEELGQKLRSATREQNKGEDSEVKKVSREQLQELQMINKHLMRLGAAPVGTSGNIH